ncbi:hypothetical protein SPHINGO8AM_190027 [Sphingomonas sp. 8AM]|nr:hypothetical protein SPHINGO8AM_190027 [Sphingomonas sp. 8AM]
MTAEVASGAHTAVGGRPLAYLTRRSGHDPRPAPSWQRT